MGERFGMLESILYYLQTQSWFPTDNGLAMPGIQPLFVFVLMVVAMFLRGTRLPSRGELVEQRLPLAPRALTPPHPPFSVLPPWPNPQCLHRTAVGSK